MLPASTRRCAPASDAPHDERPRVHRRTLLTLIVVVTWAGGCGQPDPLEEVADRVCACQDDQRCINAALTEDVGRALFGDDAAHRAAYEQKASFQRLRECLRAWIKRTSDVRDGSLMVPITRLPAHTRQIEPRNLRAPTDDLQVQLRQP